MLAGRIENHDIVIQRVTGLAVGDGSLDTLRVDG